MDDLQQRLADAYATLLAAAPDAMRTAQKANDAVDQALAASRVANEAAKDAAEARRLARQAYRALGAALDMLDTDE